MGLGFSAMSEQVSQAYQSALRWLGRRDYTRYEMAHRLRAKGFAEPVIEEVLHRLEAERWLSDERVRERLIERLTEQEPSGNQRIEQELRRRGLALPAGLPEDELKRAVEALHQRFGHPPAEVDSATCARWYRFLLRRGFEPEVAERALRQWHPALEDAFETLQEG